MGLDIMAPCSFSLNGAIYSCSPQEMERELLQRKATSKSEWRELERLRNTKLERHWNG